MDSDFFREGDFLDGYGMNNLLKEETEGSLLSSGTSGRGRLRVDFVDPTWSWLESIYLRGFCIAGYNPFKSKTYFWYEKFDEGLYNKIIARKNLVHKDLSLEQQLKLCEEYNDDYLVYYPQVLLTIAKKKLRTRKKYDITPKLIFTHGEILTENMREVISDAFELTTTDKIFNHYGTTEFNRVAWECPSCGEMHINEDSVYVQVVDAEGNEIEEGTGRLIGTALANRITPIIRYDIGDIVELKGSNYCDKTRFKTISDIKGRDKDIIRTEFGNVMPNEVVNILAKYIDILEYQVLVKEDEYILKYVPNRGFKNDTLDSLKNELGRKGIEPVTFQQIDKVDRTPGGKIQIIKNQRN